MKITIKTENPQVKHTLASIVKNLNGLVCSYDYEFFNLDKGAYDSYWRINFESCCNNNGHNKLISILSLWFCQNQCGFVAFYAKPYISLGQGDAVQSFGHFVASLPALDKIQIVIE